MKLNPAEGWTNIFFGKQKKQEIREILKRYKKLGITKYQVKTGEIPISYKI